jgi:hypothetical protein
VFEALGSVLVSSKLENGIVDRYPQIEPYDRGMLDVGGGQQLYWETCGNPAGTPAVVLPSDRGDSSTPTPTASCCSTSAGPGEALRGFAR